MMQCEFFSLKLHHLPEFYKNVHCPCLRQYHTTLMPVHWRWPPPERKWRLPGGLDLHTYVGYHLQRIMEEPCTLVEFKVIDCYTQIAHEYVFSMSVALVHQR